MVGFQPIQFAALRASAGLAAISVLTLGAAGCVSAPPPESAAPPSALYVGADRLNGAAISETKDRLAYDERPGAPVAAAPQAVAMAPQPEPGGAMSAGYVAGELGPCGAYAKIEQDQPLGDVARECGVSEAALAAFNPGIAAPGIAAAGSFIAIPPVGETANSIVAAPKSGFGWYVSRQGDTLETIAASHLATPADLIRLNPGVTWDLLGVGATVKVPAAYEPVVAGQGVVAFAGGARSAPRNEAPLYAYPASRLVTGVMPYNYRPQTANGGGDSGASLLLSVDRQSVKPGGKVVVSGENLPPNSDVSLYRGANGRQMEYVGSVKTDAAGAFSEPVRVKRSTDLGGVIFKATVDKSGQSLQSRRVGVDKLKASDELEPENDDDSDD